MPSLERVSEGCVLAEAPHWDAANQQLFFVDIPGKKIFRYIPSSKKLTKASFDPRSPSFIIPVEGKKDQFVVGADNELLIISWNGESDKITIVEKLTSVERSSKAPQLAFNDGKCDSSGRLWTGTQSLAAQIPNTEPLGSMYSYDAKQKFKKHVDGIRIANGLAFNDKTKKMYYIDSLQESVDQFDFDITSGTISKRQVWFTFKKFNVPGMPDGMAIDTDGNLWVAVFGGGRVLKVDGSKPETLLESIEIPAEQVTSVAFGGKNLDELYVTTAALETAGKKLPPPDNGAVYKVTGTGSKGFNGDNFKLN